LVNLRESKEQIQKIGEINKKTNQISDFHQYKRNLKLSLSNKKEVFGIYNPMKFSLLAKNPNSFDGLKNCASVLAYTNNLQKALEYYERALKISPKHQGVIDNIQKVKARINQTAVPFNSVQ
jgi:tetratricopeptide (TPR) repeat protein